MDLVITRPDDWHVHLRDGGALATTANHTARQFARAVVMPNLKPPVTTVERALDYRRRILDALQPGLRFEPLMTLYLTDGTGAAEIMRARDSGAVFAGKLYPAGATTNSDSGVTDVRRLDPVLAAMAEAGLPLLVHGETTNPAVDVFDREKVFVETVLGPLVGRHPGLKVVLEHVTTREGVEFVAAAGPQVAGTITAHHLLYNRNALFAGGLRPHLYCLPVLKREAHRLALLEAATGGDPSFFLGTDSAPHARGDKECGCGCAGIYTAFAALELYAMAFAAAGRLDRLEGFASFHGADFYGLPRNEGTVTLRDESWRAPQSFRLGGAEVVPLDVVPLEAGRLIGWRLEGPALPFREGGPVRQVP